MEIREFAWVWETLDFWPSYSGDIQERLYFWYKYYRQGLCPQTKINWKEIGFKYQTDQKESRGSTRDLTDCQKNNLMLFKGRQHNLDSDIFLLAHIQ